MAVEFIEAVYDLPDLNATECAVLAYLANKANPRGECWPSRTTIAAKVRLHPDTVKVALQALANPDRPGGALIGKESRYSDGRQVPNRIVLLLTPKVLRPTDRGDAPPAPGVLRPPSLQMPGDQAPPGDGGSTTPGKNRHKEPSKLSREIASRLWAIAAKPARQRSGMADVERAVAAALARGHDAESIVAGVGGYFAGERQQEEGGRFCMGLHRLMEQDRWREWAPDPADLFDGDEPGPASAPAVKAPSADELAAHMARVWRTRLEDFGRIQRWDRAAYGPRPGEPGCRAPAEILTEAGYAGP